MKLFYIEGVNGEGVKYEVDGFFMVSEFRIMLKLLV